MRCKIFCKGDFACGNLSTAHGLHEIIKKVHSNAEVSIHSISSAKREQVNEKTEEASEIIDVAIVIHLRRISEVVKGLDPRVTLIAICGGTDLNEDAKNHEYLTQMNEVVERSKAVVLFSPSMLDKFAILWPNYRGLVEVISQSVSVDVDKALAQRDYSLTWLSDQFGSPIDRFFIVAGRLRPVKDPNYVYQPFIEWNTKPRPGQTVRHHLIYIGSVEERTPSIQQFLASLTDPYVHHVDSIEKDLLHAILLRSDGLINCSISEGQSVTIMEALSLGTPVIARDNPGNRDLIQHNENGLLFNTPEELQQCLTRLCCEPGLRGTLIQNGRISMQESRFQPANQIDSYVRLFGRLNL